MKYLLIGINSKYSHTNLAIRLLKAYCDCDDVKIREFSINESMSFVMSQIMNEKADALFFSCYIWNIEYIKELCSSLRKITTAKIILGGPEVSFNTKEFMEKYSFTDAVIAGEGEITFSELVKNNLDFKNTDGVVYKDSEVIQNKPRELISDISEIPFPYTNDEIKSLDGRLIYYETQRGCPFNCSYCMSSTVKGVRFRDLELVKSELKFFIENGVKIVKLTDRTFNSDNKRTLSLLKFLIETGGKTTFHFEISAHILNDEIFNLLKTAPKGLFQFEIGVQSTNPATISEINRKTDFEKLKKEVLRIKELGNIHIHLDLIAGLPFEDFKSFKKSFNDVFALRPDMLQLGFLKLLHGTKIRNDELKHAYIYSDFPPYEVLGNKYISYFELLTLKNIEEITDKYYNSGVFKNSLEFLLTYYNEAFDMFCDIKDYFEEHRLFKMSHSKNGLFDILADFAKSKNIDEAFFDILKLDFCLDNNHKTPEWSLKKFDPDFGKMRFSLIENNPEAFLEFSDMPLKDIIKQVYFEEFSYDVLGDLKKQDCVLIFKKNGEVLTLNKFLKS